MIRTIKPALRRFSRSVLRGFGRVGRFFSRQFWPVTDLDRANQRIGQLETEVARLEAGNATLAANNHALKIDLETAKATLEVRAVEIAELSAVVVRNLERTKAEAREWVIRHPIPTGEDRELT